MHIMFMVFILVQVYFISLIIIYFLKDKLNTKITNFTFILLIFGFFAILNIHFYYTSGLKNFMTFDNISPLTFTLLPLVYVMKKEVKESFLAMIAFLSVGMFLAMLISPNYNYLFSFKQNATPAYAYDSLSHLFCSLFGIYLIISGQVKVNLKNLLKSMAFIYTIISFAVILNFIFHKDYFGMDPYNGASIYMFDFFSNFYVTLIAYYLGIALVLILGFQLGYLMNKLSNSKKTI